MATGAIAPAMSIRINVVPLPTSFSRRAPWSSTTEAVRAVLRPLWRPMLATLMVLWLTRLGLAIWLAPRVEEAGAWSHLWWQGLRFDAVWLGLIWALPAGITPWMARHRASGR